MNYPQQTYMTYRFKLFKYLNFSPQIWRIKRICTVFLNLENYKKKSAAISGISGEKNGRELFARNLYALYVYSFKCLNFSPQIWRIERICPVFLNLENYKKKSAGICGISGKKNGRELFAINLYALYVYIFLSSHIQLSLSHFFNALICLKWFKYKWGSIKKP